MLNSKEHSYYKPVVNFLPENLDLDNWLSNIRLDGITKFSKDDCAGLISNLYERELKNKKLRDDNGSRDYINLSSKIMYAQTKEYTQYINLFLHSNIWESDYTYEMGKKSIGYRFTEEYYNQPCKKYLNFKKGGIVKDSKSLAEEVTDENKTATVKSLINALPSLTIDYDKAIVKLKEDYANGTMTTSTRNCTYCAIEKINNGEFFAKQDNYGRLHTNLTNLKKEFRNYLTVDGEKLISFDLKNSQPFFSTILTKACFWEGKADESQITFKSLNTNITDKVQNIDSIIMFTKSVEDNEDLLCYVSMVLDGSLYEFFLKALNDYGIICDDRNMAKKAIFKIFFSEQVHLDNDKRAKLFKSLFPTIFELFRLIKKGGHNLLALILQAIESNIVIEGIASNFMQKHKDVSIYTIHDSVVVPQKNSTTLKDDIVKYTVSKTGFKPSVQIEYLVV